MRPIWSGTIAFALVNIPVSLYSASEEHSLSFNLLHKKDLSPVRYAKYCKAEEIELTKDDIVKGYEYEKDMYVIISDEDFIQALPQKTKSIEITSFAFEEEIDSIYFEKPYILEPGKGAAKAYTLLREALFETQKVAVASFVMHNKEHLAVIKPYGRALVLHQMRYAAEIKDFNRLELPVIKTVSKELDIAVQLIDQLTEPFDPEKYRNNFVEEMLAVIEAKIKKHKIHPKGIVPQATMTGDLMSKLKASLQVKSPPRRRKSNVAVS